MDFERFYVATAERVLRVARRVARGDSHLAWESTQEAYARMLERWSERQWVRLEDNYRYAVSIAVNGIMDCYRQRSRVTDLDDEHDCGVEDGALDAVLDKMSIQRAVREFLDRQPNRRRAVGVLFLIVGCETADIAKTLGMAESTVRTHVERLRVSLKPYIDRLREIERRGELP